MNTRAKDTVPSADDDEDPSFDKWLQRSLNDLYAPVLEEPIPDEMADILKKHHKKD